MSVCSRPFMPGGDVDERLVVEELGGVLRRELGVAADLDPAGRGDGVGRQLVDDEDLGCAVAEVLVDGRPSAARRPPRRSSTARAAASGARPSARRGSTGPARPARAASPGRTAAAGSGRRTAGGCTRGTPGCRATTASARSPRSPSASRSSHSSIDVAGPEQPPGRGDAVEHRARVDRLVRRLRAASARRPARNSSRIDASQPSADSTRIGLATSCRIVAARRYRSS